MVPLTSSETAPAEARAALMEAVMLEYETPLLRYAARIVNSASLAQDVVQNAFVKLFRGWDGAAQPSPQLKSWLYRVTHNEAIDLIRRESRLRVLHDREAHERECCPPDDEAAATTFADRRAAVLEQLRHLHPREQQVVLLRLEQGLGYQEIARITGRSTGNVGNILHHAIRKLAARLQRNEES